MLPLLLPRTSTPRPDLSFLPSHALGPSRLPPLASPGTIVDFRSHLYNASGNLSFTPSFLLSAESSTPVTSSQ